MARNSWNTISDAQKRMARKFSDASEGMSVSQAAKYLDECFKLAKGEMSEEEFERVTGHKPHTLRW